MTKKVGALLFLAVVLLAVVAACGGGGGSGSSSAGHSTSVKTIGEAAARGCAAGYAKAKLPWGSRCLVHGELCKQKRAKAYVRFGFHCRSGRLD